MHYKNFKSFQKDSGYYTCYIRSASPLNSFPLPTLYACVSCATHKRHKFKTQNVALNLNRHAVFLCGGNWVSTHSISSECC